MGRAVSAAEIKVWDIDVRPDGTGLPPGSGTVAQGEALYQDQCSHCHGVRGVGGSYDPLVGRLPGDAFPFGRDPTIDKTIGNYWPYATTLYDYIRRSMPFTRPGSLSDNDVYALAAYLLYLNQLLERDTVLDATTLVDIKMPSRNRFEIDDRTTSENFRPPGAD